MCIGALEGVIYLRRRFPNLFKYITCTVTPLEIIAPPRGVNPRLEETPETLLNELKTWGKGTGG